MELFLDIILVCGFIHLAWLLCVLVWMLQCFEDTKLIWLELALGKWSIECDRYGKSRVYIFGMWTPIVKVSKRNMFAHHNKVEFLCRI